MRERDAVEAVTRDLEKLFPGQVVHTVNGGQHTWTVSGTTVLPNGIDQLDNAVSDVNPHLKGWALCRPDSKGNVYHLDKDSNVAWS